MMKQKFFNGIMLDISRGQVPKLSTLKVLIKEAAKFNINFISLYIEHTFQFKNHPIVWGNSGAFSKNDIENLIQYSKKYNIEIIPSIQAMGHLENVLKHKEYAHLAETSQYYSIAPVLKESYTFLEDIISDIAETFESEYINIGCDEVWDIGQGKSMQYAKRIGGDKELFLQHIVKIKKIVNSHNKKVMIWGDMLIKYKDHFKSLPKDIIILNWHYEDTSVTNMKKRISKIGKDNLNQMICPGVSTWTNLFPLINKGIDNIKNSITAALEYKKGIYGYMITTWGDNGNFNFLGEAVPGFLFFSHIISNLNIKRLNIKNINNILYKDFWGIKNRSVDLYAIFSFFGGLYKLLPVEKYYDIFFYFWDSPFFKELLDKYEDIKKIMALYKKSLEYFKKMDEVKPTKSKMFFNELIYKMSIVINFLKRVLDVNEIKRLYDRAYSHLEDEVLVKNNIIDIVDRLKRMSTELKWLRKKYKKLWLYSYRKPGLEFNLSRFIKLEKIYKNKATELKKSLKDYIKPGGELSKIEF